jgi:tetratricopeptide (TPR) repeat protein
MNGKVTRRDLVCLIPFGLIGLGIAVVTVHFQAAATDYRLETSRFAFRLARAGSLPWLYLREIFLPVGLSPLSQQWRPDLHSPITYLPLLLLLSLLLVFVWKRQTWGKALLLASLYYLWMLLPVLGLIWMTFQQQAAWADWWQYLAVPAIFAVIAAGFAMVVRSGHKSRTVCAYVSLGLAISLLLAQTWRRCAIYDSMESYCRAVISEQPHMWALQNNLGIILKERGEFAQAAACYRAALRDNPGYVQAHNNLANVLQAQGEWKQAEAEFWAALQLEPRNCEVLANLSQTFFVEGKMRAALVTNAKAIKADPINPEHYVQFGVKLLANNQFNKALVCFKNARVLSPPNSRFELELARSLIGTSPVMLARCELQLPTWSQPIDR